MKRVVTILGTRPEIIRLSRIISTFDENFEHIVMHTGQNFDENLSKIFFDDLEIREPDFYLDCRNTDTALAISAVIQQAYFKLKDIKPDAVFILGDTDSALSAIAAKSLKIPIFHYEAGNRCFDFNVPEEINRKLVDSISDINLCYSNIAKQNLLNEGHKIDKIFKVGSPMLEVISHYKEKIKSSKILDLLKLEQNEYFVLSTHRSENVDNPEKLEALLNTMRKVLSSYPYKILFPVHPRTKSRLLGAMSKIGNLDRLILIEPLSFTDYIYLQKNALCTFSDSGTLTEEAAILNFNALSLRETNERQEGFEAIAPIMVGYSEEQLMSSLDFLIRKRSENIDIPVDYMMSDVSGRIYRIVQSYIQYVDKNVWHKTT